MKLESKRRRKISQTGNYDTLTRHQMMIYHNQKFPQ